MCASWAAGRLREPVKREKRETREKERERERERGGGGGSAQATKRHSSRGSRYRLAECSIASPKTIRPYFPKSESFEAEGFPPLVKPLRLVFGGLNPLSTPLFEAHALKNRETQGPHAGALQVLLNRGPAYFTVS